MTFTEISFFQNDNVSIPQTLHRGAPCTVFLECRTKTYTEQPIEAHSTLVSLHAEVLSGVVQYVTFSGDDTGSIITPGLKVTSPVSDCTMAPGTEGVMNGFVDLVASANFRCEDVTNGGGTSIASVLIRWSSD
jgi:hypothetical protein